MKKYAVLAALVALTACVGPQKHWQSTLGTPTMQEAKQVMYQCEYEAEANARSRTPGMRTMIGAEVDRLTHKDELFTLCMRAKGYAQVVVK